jgi:hypothetical protein
VPRRAPDAVDVDVLLDVEAPAFPKRFGEHFVRAALRRGEELGRTVERTAHGRHRGRRVADEDRA